VVERGGAVEAGPADAAQAAVAGGACWEAEAVVEAWRRLAVVDGDRAVWACESCQAIARVRIDTCSFG